MILELYTILTLFSILLIFAGYLASETSLLIIGYTFFFIIHIAVLVSGIDYHTGDTVTDISDSVTNIVKNYDTYTNNTLFILLSALGLVGGAVLSWGEIKARRSYED